MKRSVGIWQLWGFAVTVLLGTVLHFLYEWLGEAKWIAPFSGVNESTWEHMKLLFACVQWIFVRDRRDFWCVKLRGILLGLALIPILFYTYNGVIGKSPDWVNISIFFIAAACTYLYENRLFRNTRVGANWGKLAFSALVTLVLLFVVFTFAPPELGIFRDPLTGGYGMR